MTPDNNMSTGPCPLFLIVDDEEDIRQVVSLVFQEAGFRVNIAENTACAIGLLKKEMHDVVISDVMMPGVDGLSLLAAIRREYPEIPVILMTGHAQLQMALDAIENGAFGFVQKPFSLEQLKSIADKALTYSRQIRHRKELLAELEEELATRSAELDDVKVKLDYAHSRILKSVTAKAQPIENTPQDSNPSDSVPKIISRLV